MVNSQTLSEADRRLLALWAADCASRVVLLVDGDAECVETITDAVERARAFGNGESTAAAEIKLRMRAVKAAGKADSPAGAAAARSVAQAAAVAHMGAHALGAAAYAAKAVSLSGGADSVDDEIVWQISHLSSDQRRALKQLPAVGCDEPGPLGPGLLSRGFLGDVVRRIQASIAGE
ncbi:hypothetical protein EDD41_1635 [Luteococcus japonicus]|uniref:Imm-5-like domain-containing protein n=1 Tax=Luteococcus japonicus TaxID=33984 RepID=A0A3N1ZUL6_9ACTN|nr:hypothetical protein [Luteococcus japonicus]ROR54428.1 hypothetical protein EDD41_1635 [Luteococcus japonicus]